MTMQVPIGTTVAYAGAVEPLGWKWSNGQSVVAATYPRLTGVLATIGIVPSAGNLPLPDLRGMAPVAPVSPSGTTFTSGGDKGALAGAPDHFHYGSSDLKTGFDIIDTDPVYGLKAPGGPAVMPGQVYVTSGGAAVTRTMGYGNNTGTGWLGDAGGGPLQPHNNLAPFILLNYIIKVTGEGVQGYPVGSLLPFCGAAARIESFTTSGGQVYANTIEPHGFVVGDRVHVKAPDTSGSGEYEVGPTASANQLGLLGSVPAAFAVYGTPSPTGPLIGYVSPAGWLVTSADAYGYQKVGSLYTPLYGVIAGVFGENASVFNTPDTRGRIVHGRDNMNRGSSSGMIGSDVMGLGGGADGHTLAYAEMATHRHVAGTLGALISFGEVGGYGVYPEGLESIGYQGITEVAAFTWETSHAVSGFTGVNPGAGNPHNNMPKYVAVPHLIKY